MKEDSSANIKCFSVISLARKCVSLEFRQCIRSEALVYNVFKDLAEAASDQNFAPCASTVIYLMSRDFISIHVDAHSLRLFSQLLHIEKLDQDEEQKKYAAMVWKVTSYLERMEAVGKKIVFHVTQDQLTPFGLILEAIAFTLARSTDENLKTKLLNLGILQYIVGKIEKIVLRLLQDKLTEAESLQQLYYTDPHGDVVNFSSLGNESSYVSKLPACM